jgi:hypothetical protein
MIADTKKILDLIGADRIEAAIEALINGLEHRSGDDDLFDQVILQKGRWANYHRKSLMDVANSNDIDKIRHALLQITRELDKRQRSEKASAPQQPNNPAVPQQFKSSPPQPQYIAECFFNGDMNKYFVMANNQIVGVNPMTNHSMAVASRVASMDTSFAWIYQLPNGLYYNIDHNGVIWGVNTFGLPMQMGYVRYF